MILKSLYLMLEGYEPEVTYPFLKRSRHVCNYIEREVLREGRYAVDGFNRIVVTLCVEPPVAVFVNSSSVAVVQLAFDQPRYTRLSGRELSLYYIDTLRDGLDKCARSIAIPKAEIFEGLATFIAGGMKNEWVHKDRQFKKLGLRAVLRCFLDQNQFRLQIELFSGLARVFESTILETDPDEIAFEHRFKDIVVEENRLIVTSRHEGPLWQMPLAKIAKARALANNERVQ